jgi:hypothetical protein
LLDADADRADLELRLIKPLLKGRARVPATAAHGARLTIVARALSEERSARPQDDRVSSASSSDRTTSARPLNAAAKPISAARQIPSVPVSVLYPRSRQLSPPVRRVHRLDCAAVFDFRRKQMKSGMKWALGLLPERQQLHANSKDAWRSSCNSRRNCR